MATVITTAQITDAAKQSAEALAASLQMLLKTSEGNARAFAAKYAPDLVQWGLDLAAAKAAGDTETIAIKEEDFNELAVDAIAEATELAIDSEIQVEAAIKGAFATAASFAVAALIAA